jgi:hypothetical protein
MQMVLCGAADRRAGVLSVLSVQERKFPTFLTFSTFFCFLSPVFSPLSRD